jgi:PAS domain S-box-containing protein
MGADDYLLKGRLDRLPAAIFNAIEKHRMEQERKHFLDLAFQAERRFRLLVEWNEDMMALSNVDGDVFYASPSFVRKFGYSEAEITSTSFAKFVDPQDLELYLKNIKRIKETPGSSFHQQLQLQHKDGHMIWCEATKTNLLHEAGIEAIVTNFRDISEKKLAEIQKQFDKENLDALINNTDDLMWSVDLNYRLISFNQPFIDAINSATGRRIHAGDNVFDFNGIGVEQFLHKSNYDRVFSADSSIKVEVLNANGEYWFEVSYKPIWHKNKIVGAACDSRDVSKIKLVNQELAIQKKRFR